MSFHLSRPSAFLSPYVKQYWGIENCLPLGETHIQRIVPNGLMELTFYLGDKPRSLDRKRELSENILLSGHQRGYHDLEISGRLSLFSVSLLPYGAKMLFNNPACEFRDQNYPLKYLLKEKVAEVENRLYESGNFDEKVAVIESFLSGLLKNNCNQYEINRIARVIDLINRSKGATDIQSLSSAACLCRKQFERIFSEYIGTSPKQFLRTIRFQSTLNEKNRNKNISLPDLVFKAGYYDQSHMINEFKIFSGKTPSEYFSECEPYSDYFQ